MFVAYGKVTAGYYFYIVEMWQSMPRRYVSTIDNEKWEKQVRLREPKKRIEERGESHMQIDGSIQRPTYAAFQWRISIEPCQRVADWAFLNGNPGRSDRYFKLPFLREKIKKNASNVQMPITILYLTFTCSTVLSIKYCSNT